MAIKSEVVTLSGNLDQKIEVEGDTVGFGDTTFIDNVPEGITVEQLYKAQEYIVDFQTAAAISFAKAGGALLDTNKDIDVVSATIKMGKRDTLSLGLTRPADDVPTYTGELFVHYEAPNDIADVRQHLTDLAAQAATVDESAELED